MSTYHHAELTRTASVSALHDLFHVIISILLEPKMEQLADGTQLLRALNVLTVKIIDRSNHTNIMSAIVKLLSDAVANSSVNPKFAETVMKCMWKIIRLLPIWMDDEAAQALDIDIVLCDLHEFLKTYPPSYWKKQESDTPLRTVKTVLHAMVKVSLTPFFSWTHTLCRECVRNLDLRVQVHPGEFWVSKQLVLIVLEASQNQRMKR